MKIWRIQDTSCWKELNEYLIFYYNDHPYHSCHLKIRNVQTNFLMEYMTIYPLRLVVLSQSKFNLYICIETSKKTLIVSLNKISLKLKICYRICQREENISRKSPFYALKKNTFLLDKDHKMIQMNRFKMMRKFNGRANDIVKEEIIFAMVLKYFRWYKINYKLFKGFEMSVFQEFLGISLKKLQMYGEYHAEHLGGFFILKPYRKKLNHQRHLKYHPIYYVHIDFILKGVGKHGMVIVENDEEVKLVKCFNDQIYILIKQMECYRVYKCDGECKRALIYSLSTEKIWVQNPILQINSLIFTKPQEQWSAPFIYKIEQIGLNKEKKQK